MTPRDQQRLCILLAVYNEELLLPGALHSLPESLDMQDVCVFDGAWKGFADDTRGASSDGTGDIAKAAGAVWYPAPMDGWASQEEKRSMMFELALQDEMDYTHAFVMDADERLEGSFPSPLPDSHANVMVACVGPNDMPGIRGEWPRGDYSVEPKPELRLFKLSAELHCKWPGGYWDEAGKIEPYADYQGTSALPVLAGVMFTHHGAERPAERIEQKIAYYHEEHPKRAARQRAQWMADKSAAELRAMWKQARNNWHSARVAKDDEATAAAARRVEELEAAIHQKLNPRKAAR